MEKKTKKRNTKQAEPQLVNMNEQAFTPEFILAQASQHAHEWQSVAIAFVTKDDKLGSYISNQPASHLSIMINKLQIRLFNLLSSGKFGS